MTYVQAQFELGEKRPIPKWANWVELDIFEPFNYGFKTYDPWPRVYFTNEMGLIHQKLNKARKLSNFPTPASSVSETHLTCAGNDQKIPPWLVGNCKSQSPWQSTSKF